MRPPRILLALACALSGAVGCEEPSVPSKVGYRAILSFSKEDRYDLYVKGEKRRVEGVIDGSTLVKIARPDLKVVWQFRPSTKKVLETAWGPQDEIVPGYPLDPRFDSVAYADRFGAANSIRQVGDGIQGLHPCDRWLMELPSGDRVILFVARDLERLVVRIEHEKRDDKDEMQPFTVTELFDVRPGVRDSVFEKPKGYAAVSSYEALSK